MEKYAMESAAIRRVAELQRNGFVAWYYRIRDGERWAFVVSVK